MEYPHIVHADVMCTRLSYPTHTHGLSEIGLPELFINATCFGPVNNCMTINMIVSELLSNESLFVRVSNHREEIECDFLEFESNEDLLICLRPVPEGFLGVLAAYPNKDTNERMFSQIYVKGDDHVLDPEFYRDSMDFGRSAGEV